SIQRDCLFCKDWIDFIRVDGSDSLVPLRPDARNLPAKPHAHSNVVCSLPGVLGIISLVVQRLPRTRESSFGPARAESEQHGSEAVAAGAGTEPVQSRDIGAEIERSPIESLVVAIL